MSASRLSPARPIAAPLANRRLHALLAALMLLTLSFAGGPASADESTPGAAGAVSTAAVPTGFTDTVAYRVTAPTALAHTPDGRLLITQDAGQLRVVRNGRLIATPALNLAARSCAEGDRGLMGVTVDPAFSTNRFVYLYWSFNKHNFCGVGTSRTPVNRVTRHVLGADDRVVAGSERVLIDNIASPARDHNGGDLRFGADGLLYVTTGDGGCVIGDPTRCAGLNTNSRRRDILNGKVLRVTRDGAIPRGNPFASASGARRCGNPAGVPGGTGTCAETFAWGFRNPFRFAVRPGTSSFYVNDVGQATWEEIDALVAGRDYGWNAREGFCARGSTTDCGSTTYQNPIFAYGHADGCASITGGAFVPEGLWPAPWSGSYLFADFVCGGIYRLAPRAGGGFTRQPFLPDVRGAVHLAFAPHGSGTALYYLDYFGNTVHRVSRSTGNTAPVANFSTRPAGLDVTFGAQNSHDPDAGDSLRQWRWDFGDGTTATTTTPSIVHQYPTKRVFTATLRVVDSRGAVSAPVRRSVYAGEWPPTVSVAWPASTARFAVGQRVTLSATARDAEDGTRPGSSITWTVTRRHGSHSHPYAGPVNGSSFTLTYPPPEDLVSTTNSHLVVTAQVVDSRGLTTSSTRNLLPRTVRLSFASVPSGGSVIVGGTNRVTPFTVTSWAGAPVLLDVRDQSIGGVPHVFRRWSDGGARSHTIRTPTSATTYTATFTRAGG
jgi:glucose/arabinose dehydrogenase/PKD repeat protein